MLPRSVLASALALGLVLGGLAAHAQPTQSTPEVLPPADDEGSGQGDTPAPEAPEKKAPRTPAAGYAYGDKPTASRAPARSRYRRTGPVVNHPGFEQTADGASRLFVNLSQNVPVEERRAQGSITYVLKGASPRVRNNTNALVTVHFNTPVSRARLVPHGQDLHFVIELRAAAAPTWKMNEAQDKSATLTIDFPKGDFLPANGEPPAAQPRAARGNGPAKRPAPAPAPKEEAPSDGPQP